MSKILPGIPRRAFELIRDRICEILADELPVQSIVEYDGSLDATVYCERFIPFDKTDIPCVNVLLAKGIYNNKAVVKADGTYTYNVDCYMSAKSSVGVQGDTVSAIKLQKLIGICCAILENPQYNTLGFARPFISHTEVSEIAIADPKNNQDAVNVMMGRISFVVRVPENVDALLPRLLVGFDTQVKLGLTEKGYVFSGDSFPGPPPIPGVEIIDQFDNVIYNAPVGTQYRVLVFDEIFDGTPVSIPIDEIVDDPF